MPKTVCLLLAFVLFCCSLTGCDDPKREDFKRLDEDKAAEVALSYMNEKYDETFYVVKSEKDAEHGYVPGSIQDAWVDVTVAIAGDEAAKKYAVRLRLNADKENYDIICENYMTSLVQPWVKKEMDEILSLLKINEYFTICNNVTNVMNVICGNSRWGFTMDFPVIQESSEIKEIAKNQEIDIKFFIALPDSSYTSDIEMKIQELYEQFFYEDNVVITIVAYTDDYYRELKEAHDIGNPEPPGSIANQISYKSIYIS